MTVLEGEDLLRSLFKLSMYEARCYLALLRSPMSAKEVSSHSKVPLPRVYDTMRRLQEMGFAEESDGTYSAVEPKVALKGRVRQFDERYRSERSRIVEALGALSDQLESRSRHYEMPETVVIRGIHGIANRFIQVFGESREVFLTIRRAFEARSLFMDHLGEVPSRAKKTVRVLLPPDVVLTSGDEEFVTKMGIQIRRHGAILFDMMVADDRDVMIGVPDPATQQPFHSVAIWIRNPPFARALRESLEEVWNNA